MIGENNELLDNPEYFFCERFRCKLKIGACIERQQANAGRRPIDRIPYEDCLNCEQGGENQASYEAGDAVKGKPARGQGERKVDCEHYESCLSFAAKRDWKTFNCARCPLSQKEGDGVSGIKKVNTRICETPGCGKLTLNTNCRFCGGCMARRGKKIREAKAAAATSGQVALKGNGKISVDPRSLILEQVSRGAKESGDGLAVIVNFGPYPELHSEIEHLAKSEFRSIEGQILSVVSAFMARISEQKEHA